MTPCLALTGISKTFPGVMALEDVALDIFAGEVHILLGENGAGKSTLMKILAGVYQPDSGQILHQGQPVTIPGPRQAQEMGISTIFQELNLIPDLSVAENIFFGREPAKAGLIDFNALYARAEALLHSLQLQLSPRSLVRELSVAQQQMVEIAKALSFEARVLTMDEPTSALSDKEVEALFGMIRQLRQKQVAIVYISHRFEELFQIGDRVTVLRDGRTVASRMMVETDQDELIQLMVGRPLQDIYPKRTVRRGQERLRAEGLSDGGFLQDISFSLYAGELLGIAGLMGSGRTELLRLLFGADPLKGGRLYLDGQVLTLSSPRQAVGAGIGLLTEDRKHQGLVLEMPVRENTTLAALKAFTQASLINRRQEAEASEKLRAQLRIKTPHIEQRVRFLSGGNQQKVVLAKWLVTQARVLLFDEPTRGIDMGARLEIYELMHQLLEQGVALLMVSSDLLEILGMSDRILVMNQGRITADLPREEATQESILYHATQMGAKK